MEALSTPLRGGFHRYFSQVIAELPIRTANFSDRADRARHDGMVQLVDQMLATKKQWTAATTEAEKRRLDQLCSARDREIDNVVYELYELRPDDIKLVDESAKR